MKMTGSRPGVHSQKSRHTSGSLQNMAGFDGISSGWGPPKFGAVFKKFGADIAYIIAYVLYIYICVCMALPMLRLPQMKKAAPNGAACCPFGAGFRLPQLSRRRSCHALHTGTSGVHMPHFAVWA